MQVKTKLSKDQIKIKIIGILISHTKRKKSFKTVHPCTPGWFVTLGGVQYARLKSTDLKSCSVLQILLYVASAKSLLISTTRAFDINVKMRLVLVFESRAWNQKQKPIFSSFKIKWQIKKRFASKGWQHVCLLEPKSIFSGPIVPGAQFQLLISVPWIF